MQNETTPPDDYTLRKADARDLPRLRGYFEGLSDVARRNRFHVPLKSIRDELVAFMLSRSHCAVVAEDKRDGTIIGEAVMAVDPAGEKAETGISVAEDWQGRGLGNVLLRELEKSAKAVGARLIYGDMLGGNAKMLKLAKRREYEIVRTPGDWSLSRFRKKLAGYMGERPGTQ
jgi:GNAT superfamily N-acetyltransferase